MTVIKIKTDYVELELSSDNFYVDKTGGDLKTERIFKMLDEIVKKAKEFNPQQKQLN